MSWPLGSALVLALGLAAGFGWYERRRPTARTVALVATMAAFAALGRIAFAALPNVKPTTDIVIVTGFVLGGAPGFVVGALAALSSNFFFGQGPWTPWQMAAWGVAGLIGALLGLVSRRRLGRIPLALACLVVGFLFTAVQDFGDWVNFSDHSSGALGLYLGRGIGFDAVHAAGCLVFALAFGPSLIRSLQRYSARLNFTWLPPATRAGGPGAGPLVLMIVLLGGLAGAGLAFLAGRPAVSSAAVTPLAYLEAAQNRDGGFGPSPGAPSSDLYTGWAALGLESVGLRPTAISRGGSTLLANVTATAPADIGAVERTLLVLGAAGAPPRAGGRDLITALKRGIGAQGSVSGQVNLTAFAVLALRAAAVPVPARTLSWLLRQADSDGGFNFSGAGGTSDVDDTGAVLEALAGVPGRLATRVRSGAVGFLLGQQNSDGGYPANPGGDSNAQSTAFAIQGLIAAGDGGQASAARSRRPSPLAYLHSLIAADGHVRYSAGVDQTPVWVTAQALSALSGRALPLPTVSSPAGSATAAAPTRTSSRRAPAGSRATAAHRPSARGGRRRKLRPAAPVQRTIDRAAGLTGLLILLATTRGGAG